MSREELTDKVKKKLDKYVRIPLKDFEFIYEDLLDQRDKLNTKIEKSMERFEYIIKRQEGLI